MYTQNGQKNLVVISCSCVNNTSESNRNSNLPSFNEPKFQKLMSTYKFSKKIPQAARYDNEFGNLRKKNNSAQCT